MGQRSGLTAPANLEEDAWFHYVISRTGNQIMIYQNAGLLGTVEIREEDCTGCDYYVPNAFSPNNDGNNDTFGLYTDC